MEEMELALSLRGLNHKIIRYIEKNLNKKTVERVTGANSFIIGYIAENSNRDVFQRDIEKEFGITRSTTSKIVALMTEKGLIETAKVPSDARLKKLVLTKKAQRLAEIMREDTVEVEKRITKGFTPDELKALLGYLKRLEKNISN